MKLKVNKVIVFAVCLAVLASISLGYQHPTQAIPSGFKIVRTSTGITLYNKNLDYVQILDLSKGVAIKLLHGEITASGQGQGAYGGDDPKFKFETLPQAWSDFDSVNQNAFSITNGQYFRPNREPFTNLAFPLKVNGKVISDGYAGKSEFPHQQLMLEIWNNRADIQAFDRQNYAYSSFAPNIIVGLTKDADKEINKKVGRTFMGVKDNNHDSLYETILIFNSRASTQPHAAETLKAFGADKVVMLDGGSSSQLISQGTTYVESQRTIPQTIGVVSGY